MVSKPRKITELIKENKLTYSFEVTPDVNTEQIDNMDTEALFLSITWHAKAHQCKDLDIEPLKLASFLRNKNKQVLMHLSCDLLKKHYLERVLAFLQEKGICNLFLILGESYDPNSSDFKNTTDLIKYIREISGHYFCIGVAGFCESNEERLLLLKDKVDAGVDFIITQAFFEATSYKTYVQKCQNTGIMVPIIPGVFVFETYNQLVNFTNMCKVKVSIDLMEFMKRSEESPISGVQILENVIREINSDPEFPATHFHFFTLNNIEKASYLMKNIRK